MPTDEKPEAYILHDSTQINRFYDWGSFNDITEGYLIATLQAMNFDKKRIAEAAITLEKLFNSTNAEAARNIKMEFWK